MASSGSHGAAAAAAAARKHLRVLLPFSGDSLRIPGELAGEIGAGEAFIVVPFGKGKVRRVEVGRDGGGAFLGRGWPEFAAACGVGAGWTVVLRHHGGGVLTVKAFDASCCLRELGAPAAVQTTTSSKDTPRRSQFISVLLPDSMEKMQIPAMFVQQCITEEQLNNHMAVVFGPQGKICQIALEINQSDVFFAGGWSQFMAFHGITAASSLLLRYEGNMVFTVKVFEPNGCQREFKHKQIGIQQISTVPDLEKQQEAPSASIQNCKSKNNWPSGERHKIPKGSFQRNSCYEIGPPSWIKKVINTNSLEKHLSLSTAFCDAIGLRGPCMITLKTSMNSNRSWKVHGASYKNHSYTLVRGWKRFFRDNSLNEGDICTFNVVKTTLWHVIITRFRENMNRFCYETPESKKDWSSSDGHVRAKGSMTFLKQAKTRCVFEIGPPAWIRKEINVRTIENHLNLPLPFCEMIGLQHHSTITLKTSTSSPKSWLAHLCMYQNCGRLDGSGWKSFCYENEIKVGHICTFKIVGTTVWHVIINR